MLSSISQQQKAIQNLEQFEIKQSNNFSDLVNFSKSKNEPIHRWFRYREGFSSSLVKHFLKDNADWVLDTFCGSGTTLVTSLANQQNSIGIDLNPLATFMAKIKTRKYSNSEIKSIKNQIPTIFRNPSSNIEIPELKIIHKAFNQEILEHLLVLRNNILELIKSKEFDSYYKHLIHVVSKKTGINYEDKKYRATLRGGRFDYLFYKLLKKLEDAGSISNLCWNGRIDENTGFARHLH